jgi:DNA-binding MarR family transcriptional regulator
MTRRRVANSSTEKPSGPAFLLSQVGAHAAARFAERLAPLDLTPPYAGILKVIHDGGGLSQQSLCEKLGMFPSRLVVLLDELQERGLIERQASPTDRRSHALHLTRGGCEALAQIGRIGREHQESLCAALDESERTTLTDLLTRIAEQQGLTPGVHPGYRTLGGVPPKSS